MPKIETLQLRVSDPIAQRRFYVEILGMNALSDGAVRYGREEASIRFLQSKTRYHPARNDLFWKMALSVPNIELACAQLREKAVEIGPPRQFEDVGYLAHFKDPEGFTIELIEHWFKGNRPTDPIDPARLGGGAHFNLITLRAANIDPVKQLCADWGMVPLSVQPLINLGFTLYFFAFTSDTPPVSKLTSVKNREWLYQRNYTVLEIQHFLNVDQVVPPLEDHAGYAGMLVSGLNSEMSSNGLGIRCTNST